MCIKATSSEAICRYIKKDAIFCTCHAVHQLLTNDRLQVIMRFHAHISAYLYLALIAGVQPPTEGPDGSQGSGNTDSSKCLHLFVCAQIWLIISVLRWCHCLRDSCDKKELGIKIPLL